MPQDVIVQIAGIVVLGVAAQWLAWRVGLPSILLLLVFGAVAGPVTGWIHPDDILGDLLPPLVSLSVALILYEGGLSLRLSDLPKVGNVVGRLVSIGTLVTWVIGGAAAHWILRIDLGLSVLLGALLVVTGPTVIVPLLRHIRPIGAVGPILRWEGIVIDPIGALLTVLVYEALLIGEARDASLHIVLGVLKTVVLGGGSGLLAAGLLVLLLRYYWIADHLQNAVSVMLVFAAFTVSNLFQHESGLLAVTVMGFALANQRRVDVEHIVEFKENLGILLISVLFIVLAARLDPSDLSRLAVRGSLFVGVLMLVARPLSVFLSTWRSRVTLRERLFLSAMAPRGIVAGAIASVFALRLEQVGYEDAGLLVPATFMTIIVTVAVYGLLAPFIARKLEVAVADPQGILFVGAQAWVREVAALLNREGYRVLVVDSNREHVHAARMAGLPTHAGSILAEHTLDQIELGGIGRLFAATPNDWVNVLAVQRFERVFGRAGCFQVAPLQEASSKQRHKYLHGRWLFSEEASQPVLARMCASGFAAKATRITEEFDFDAFRDHYGDTALPLFVIDAEKRLCVVTADRPAQPQAGETVISLVREPEKPPEKVTAGRPGPISAT